MADTPLNTSASWTVLVSCCAITQLERNHWYAGHSPGMSTDGGVITIAALHWCPSLLLLPQHRTPMSVVTTHAMADTPQDVCVIPSPSWPLLFKDDVTQTAVQRCR